MFDLINALLKEDNSTADSVRLTVQQDLRIVGVGVEIYIPDRKYFASFFGGKTQHNSEITSSFVTQSLRCGGINKRRTARNARSPSNRKRRALNHVTCSSWLRCNMALESSNLYFIFASTDTRRSRSCPGRHGRFTDWNNRAAGC